MLNYLQLDAMSLRFFGRSFSCVALIYVVQLYPLTRDFLDGPGQLAHPSPLLFNGRADEQSKQVF